MGICSHQFIRAAGVALAALLAASVAAAQAPSSKGQVAAIKASGSRKYTDAQIGAASGLRVGELVGREEIQVAADRLAQLGPFLSARYRFSSSGQNLTVEFLVEDAPTVPVSFDNFPWFSDAELTDALKQAVALFDGTAPEQGVILEAMTAALDKLLAGRGIRATVERTLLASPAGEGMIQQFKVLGAGMTVSAVRFTDPLAGESKRVQDRLADLVGKPYSRFALEVFVNEQVRPGYLERGYLRMRAGKPDARLTGNPDRPLPASVLVLVPIEPGSAYRWAGATWQGQGVFEPAELNGFLGMQKDELADGMKIAAGWHRLEEEYGRRGCLEAKIQPEPRFDDAAKQVSYRVTITEGPAYRMGELVVTGLSVAAENKLREAWRLAQGQTFDRTYFDQFFARLEKRDASIFGGLPVHYDQAGQWLRTNPQTRTVDVLLDFK